MGISLKNACLFKRTVIFWFQKEILKIFFFKDLINIETLYFYLWWHYHKVLIKNFLSLKLSWLVSWVLQYDRRYLEKTVEFTPNLEINLLNLPSLSFNQWSRNKNSMHKEDGIIFSRIMFIKLDRSFINI